MTFWEKVLGYGFLIGGILGLPAAYLVYTLWPNHG